MEVCHVTHWFLTNSFISRQSSIDSTIAPDLHILSVCKNSIDLIFAEGFMYILSDTQIEKIYSSPVFGDHEREENFSLDEKERSEMLPREATILKIYYIMLLGYFKVNPVRIDLDINRSQADFNFIRQKEFPGEKVAHTGLSAQMKYKIYEKIFSVVKISKFEDDEKRALVEFIDYLARHHYDTVSIFDEVIDWLRINTIETPSYRTLQILITQAFNREKTRTVQQANALLSTKTRNTLGSLLLNDESLGLFDKVRYEARTFSASEIEKEIQVFDALSDVFKEIRTALPKLGISTGRVKYYASLVTHLSLQRLKLKDTAEFNLYFLCFVYFRYSTLIDYLADALTYQIRLIEKDGRQFAKDKITGVREGMEESMVAVAKAILIFIDSGITDSQPIGLAQKKSDKIIPREELERMAHHLLRSKIEKETYFWGYVDTCKSPITKTLRGIVRRLEFVDSADNGTLYHQVETVKMDIATLGEVQSIDNRLVRSAKKFLYDDDENLIPLRAEFAVYRLVSVRLEESHWYLANSSRHKPFDEMLVGDEKWKKEKDQMIKNVNSVALNTDPRLLVTQKHEELLKKMKDVPKRIQSGENESVILEHKGGKYKWTIKYKKGEKIVNHRLFRGIPKFDVSTVIYTTAMATGLFDNIKHLTGKKKDPNSINLFIACLIGNATRQGVYKMSDLTDFSHDSLLQFQRNFMMVESLRKLCDIVSDATAKLPIFSRYNYRPGFIHASADGQKLKSRKSTRRIRFSPKYFGDGKGFFADTLLVNHVPVNVKLGSLNTHESHFLFDLLYNNSTEIVIDAVSTDTHGTNRYNFAILGLSDWQFDPRYASTPAVIESLFTIKETAEGWTLELKEAFNLEAILEGWDYVQRIIVSLHQKNIQQSDLVAKLSRSSLSDRSLTALREYDRLLKAIYLLDYIDDSDLRRYVQTALNRGEAYHQLQRAFDQIGGGKGFRGKSDTEIDMWYECSRLMANCMIHFNSVMLSYLLERYQREGKKVMEEGMAHVSPVAWTHIKLSGKYLFDHLQNTPDLHSMVQDLLAA